MEIGRVLLSGFFIFQLENKNNMNKNKIMPELADKSII